MQQQALRALPLQELRATRAMWYVSTLLGLIRHAYWWGNTEWEKLSNIVNVWMDSRVKSTQPTVRLWHSWRFEKLVRIWEAIYCFNIDAYTVNNFRCIHAISIKGIHIIFYHTLSNKKWKFWQQNHTHNTAVCKKESPWCISYTHCQIIINCTDLFKLHNTNFRNWWWSLNENTIW